MVIVKLRRKMAELMVVKLFGKKQVFMYRYIWGNNEKRKTLQGRICKVIASGKMNSIFQMMQKIARVDGTVLISGESGTGKELVARAIHFNSLRRDGPFIVVNCGALPDTLLESELFGHEKGAFTGATHTKKGLFEEAHGCVLFGLF